MAITATSEGYQMTAAGDRIAGRIRVTRIIINRSAAVDTSRLTLGTDAGRYVRTAPISATFASAPTPDTITTAGNWLTDGWKVGDRISYFRAGSANDSIENSSTRLSGTVTAVTATVITLSAGDNVSALTNTYQFYGNTNFFYVIPNASLSTTAPREINFGYGQEVRNLSIMEMNTDCTVLVETL